MRDIKVEGKDYVELVGLVKRISDSGKAFLFYDGISDNWIPFSQLESDRDEIGEGAEVKIIIPLWIAQEKEMI
jgi:hypothetical protein